MDAINPPTPPPRRRGNPLWRKGIPSPNAAGRPPAGLSLANAIRRKFSPAFICELAAGILADPAATVAERIRTLDLIARRGWPETAKQDGAAGSGAR
jgi:hypothetical protein